MNNRVAFLTTIFPMNPSYLIEFFHSLQEQSYKEFDVIVVNDNFKEFKELQERCNCNRLNIIELKYSGTPVKNREYGINYVINKKYDVLIFGDSDDYFDVNRVKISVELLESCDIIVNDLALFNETGIYQQKYISNRVKNNSQIYLDFIKDKNIFGLSNTALNVSILGEVFFPKDLIAVDWYFYTKLLLKGNIKAMFTNKTQTYYRQYDDNVIGMGNVSEEMFKKTRLIKSKHYELLSKQHVFFGSLNKYEKNLKNNLVPLQAISKAPLWWEY